jgi:hypothetical protein
MDRLRNRFVNYPTGPLRVSVNAWKEVQEVGLSWVDNCSISTAEKQRKSPGMKTRKATMGDPACHLNMELRWGSMRAITYPVSGVRTDPSRGKLHILLGSAHDSS